jgi:phytoene/squalene synthetase
VFAKLCEIESEIAGSLRPGIDHHVAHARLQWWREECERCAQGRPVHPLTRELVKVYGAVPGEQPSPLAGISGFVDTAVWDLAGATFETRKELSAYCDRWAAAMFETAAGQGAAGAAANTGASTATNSGAGATASIAANSQTDVAASMAENSRASAAAGPTARRAVNEGAGLAAKVGASDASPSVRGAGSHWRVLGAAVREIELLADLAREAHVGRLRIPLDELERAGVEVKNLAKTPWPAPLVTLMRERHEALRATIGECLGALGREQQAEFRGLLVWAALAWQQSARAQRALPNIISPRRYHALADGWLAWRAARRAAAGKLRLS